MEPRRKKPELDAEPSFTVSETDRRSAGPEDAEDGVYTLSKMALTVRRIYIEERTRYEIAIHGMSGRYEPRREWDGTKARHADGRTARKSQRPAWEQLAEFVVEYKVDARAYLAAVFSDLRINETPPTPYNLSHDDMLDRWLEIRRGCEKSIELAYRIETKAAIKHISYYQAVLGFNAKRALRVTLVDDSSGLSPLFRFSLAERETQTDIADYFFASAVMQFMRYEKFYRKHWLAMLPEAFPAQAKADYKKIAEEWNG